MALPATGLLDLAQVQIGFGGVNPIGFDEYYRGGVNVPNAGTLNSSIPTSGAISMQSFRGAKIRINYGNGTSPSFGSSGSFSVYKGPTSTLTYKGFHSSSNSLYRPLGGSSPSENIFGSLTGSAPFAFHNGPYTIGDMYSIYESRSDGYKSVWLVFSLYGSGTPPNNDATFQSVMFPTAGAVAPYNIPTGTQVKRINSIAATYSVSTRFYTRWSWNMYSGTGTTADAITSAYVLRTGSNLGYNLTYFG